MDCLEFIPIPRCILGRKWESHTGIARKNGRDARLEVGLESVFREKGRSEYRLGGVSSPLMFSAICATRKMDLRYNPPKAYPPNPYPKTHLPKMYPVNLIPKSNPEKRSRLILTSKQSLSKHSPPNPFPKSNPEKRTRQNLTLKHYPEKRSHLTLNPKCTSPKHTPRIFAPKSNLPKTYPPNPYPKTHLPKMYPVNLIPKSYPEKRSHLTLTPKRISPKHTSRNLDKKGNRRVRAPELFREFRAASIFAHPTLGRRAFPSFVVCLKWAEVSGLRRGRAA